MGISRPKYGHPRPKGDTEASTKRRAEPAPDETEAVQREAVLALSRQGSGRSPLWPQVATQGTAGKEEERCACPGTGKESK